ncbi:Nuclear Receptor-Interacting Protein 2 [Manis pentadactyla]|nr:Nuclear Receptor-Interacting Protein 2 [Manis pentadactyla]
MSTRQESEREEGDPGRRGQEAAALRDRAHLSQRRRLRQATQFAHKDSADLLPLDSLKRLGTSKDLCRDQVEQLELQLGQETVACSAQVVDDESPEFCLGLQTLLALKCCIDLEHGVLRLRAPFSELPFLPLCQEPGQ